MYEENNRTYDEIVDAEIDEISLVPRGDNDLSDVVISKAARNISRTAKNRRMNIMPKRKQQAEDYEDIDLEDLDDEELETIVEKMMHDEDFYEDDEEDEDVTDVVDEADVTDEADMDVAPARKANNRRSKSKRLKKSKNTVEVSDLLEMSETELENFLDNLDDQTLEKLAEQLEISSDDLTSTAAAISEDDTSASDDIETSDAELAEIGKSAPYQIRVLAKRAAIAEKKAEQAAKIAREERERRIREQVISKARQDFRHLSVGPDEVADLVIELAKIDLDLAERVERILRAAENQLASGSTIFREFGKAAYNMTNDMAELEAKAIEIMKSDTSLTREQAYERALREKPELYDEYLRRS